MMIAPFFLERQLPDGRTKCLMRLLDGWRLGVTPPHDNSAYTDLWDYPSGYEAWEAFEAFDGTAEPEGWVRHKPSNRRRPGGDSSKEYVAP